MNIIRIFAAIALFGAFASPVRAQQADEWTGLWVGDVTIKQVYTESMQTDDGPAQAAAADKRASGVAAMRVILHVGSQGTVRLLSHVAVLDNGRRLVAGAQKIQEALGGEPKRPDHRNGFVRYAASRAATPSAA